LATANQCLVTEHFLDRGTKPLASVEDHAGKTIVNPSLFVSCCVSFIY